MSSVYIVPRPTRSGTTRYSVRAELLLPDHQGRRVLHLGTYGDERLAWKRKIAVLDEITRHPTDAAALLALTAGVSEPRPTLTVATVAGLWLDAREDSIAAGTLRSQRQSTKSFPAWLMRIDWRDVKPSDVQRFATERGKTCKRGTVRKDLGVLRQVLDHAALDVQDALPNPASLRRLHIVKSAPKEFRLPTRAQLAAIHAVLPSRVELMLFLEHTGVRIEEAAALRWSDFDRGRDRFLVQKSKTKAGRRWVEHLDGAPPFPLTPQGVDTEALVFAKPKPGTLTNALSRAHRKHGTFLLSAHDYRRLHCSRLLHEGDLSPAQIAARVGHSSPAITLGVYSTVIPPED